MKLLARILVLLLSLCIISCSSGSNNNNNGYTPPPNILKFTATLDGASETPPNGSTASGTATLNYNDDTNIITMSVVYSGITVTVAHIHKGALGVPGDVVFPLNVTASPIMYTSPSPLTAQQESDLKSGLYYVNLHSQAFQNGEIRGQILPQ